LKPLKIGRLLIVLVLLVAPYASLGYEENATMKDSQSPTARSRLRLVTYIEHDIVRVIGNDAFEMQNWPGSGVSEDPYIIEGLNITANGYHAIVVTETSAHFVIKNCLIVTEGATADGIQIVNSSNGTIENCQIIGSRFGVYMSSTADCKVLGCRISGTLSIGVAVYYTERPTIRNNTVYDTNKGIRFQSVNNGTVHNNTVYRTVDGGIVMYHGTSNNSIVGNRIGWNGPDYLIDPLFHATDHGENRWDDNVSSGNFWTGYNGSEVFQIPGTGNAADRFPLNLTDELPPEILPHPDLDFVEGNRPPIINWTTSEIHPYRYRILFNGIRIESGLWHDREISVQIMEHPFGTYNYTLILIDAGGLQSVDSVIVRVFLIILEDAGTEIVAFSSILSVMLIVLVILAFKKYG